MRCSNAEMFKVFYFLFRNRFAMPTGIYDGKVYLFDFSWSYPVDFITNNQNN